MVGEAGNRQSIQLRPFDNGGMDGMSINGGVARSNQFTLDGAPNTSREGGTSGSLAFVPSPDAVQEVRVATSTYDAQFGRTGGGTIAVSIRSGTNQFHGTGYYIHRDAALNANLYENIVRGIPKPDIFHYNPGGTIGGPIKRNRTFFFYSYEGLKSGIPVGAGQRTPTALERAGDFSQSGVTIYDPLNTVNGVPQPFAGNVIPRNRMDPVALNLLRYMPEANSPPDAAGNNFFPPENSRFDTYTSGILRVDHNLTMNNRLFGRYAHNGRRETRAYAGREPDARTGGYHHRWNNVLSVDLTSTLNERTVTTLRAGWTRHRRLDISTPEDLGGFDSATLGYPPSFVSSIPQRFVPITVADYGGAQVGQGGGQDGVADDYYAQGQLTHVRGRHQIKTGLEYRTAQSLVDNPYRGANLGAFNFTRNFTSLRPNVATLTAADGGNAFASLLLGYAATGNVQLQAPVNWRNSYVAVFLQDDWRLSNRLTVNLGLRWDYELPTTELDNQVNGGFDYEGVALTCPACPASGLPRELRGGLTFADGAIYTSDLNNFGPRAGFTYQVTNETVLRGGYGLTFLPADTDRGTVTGFSRTTAYVASLDANRTPANRLSNPYPTGLLDPLGSSAGLATALGTNINYHIRDRKIPEYHRYSVGVQRQLPWRSVLDVSFVGSATRKRPVTRPVNDLSREQILLGDAYLNTLVPNPFVGLMPDAGATNTAATVQRRVLMRPLPQFGTINEQLVPIGFGNYQSIQATWEKRLSNGVQMLVGYTGSRTTEALSPQPGRAALRAADQHAPAARPAAQRRLDDAGIARAQLGHALCPRRVAHQYRHLPPIGRAGEHARQRRPDWRSGPGESNARAMVQHLHAHHRGRAAVLRERFRAAGVSDPRRERARYHWGTARRCHGRRAVLRRLLALQEHPPERAGELPDAVRGVQCDERRAVGGPEYGSHQHGIRDRQRFASQRSAFGAAAVPGQLLSRHAFTTGPCPREEWCGPVRLERGLKT